MAEHTSSEARVLREQRRPCLQGHEYDLWPGHFKRFADLNQSYMMVTARGTTKARCTTTRTTTVRQVHELPTRASRNCPSLGNIHMVLLSYEDVGTPEKAEATARGSMPTSQDGQGPVAHRGATLPDLLRRLRRAEDSRKENGKTLGAVAACSRSTMSASTWPATRTSRAQLPGAKTNGRQEWLIYIVNGGDINSNYAEA